MIEFPAVTVCNLNIMKVSRIIEDPKYRNLGRIDSKVKKQVQHLLSALHLEETRRSANPVPPSAIGTSSDHNDDDDDELTRRQEDSTTRKPNEKSPRRERTSQNRKTPNAQNQTSSTLQDAASNATARESTTKGRGTRLLRIDSTSTSNESSGIEPSSSGSEALMRNKKHSEFDKLANDPERELKDFRYLENNFGAVSNDYEFDQLMAHSMTSDYSDMLDLLKPTTEDLVKYGHKAKDFIIQCSMDSKNCSHRYIRHYQFKHHLI